MGQCKPCQEGEGWVGRGDPPAIAQFEIPDHPAALPTPSSSPCSQGVPLAPEVSRSLLAALVRPDPGTLAQQELMNTLREARPPLLPYPLLPHPLLPRPLLSRPLLPCPLLPRPLPARDGQLCLGWVSGISITTEPDFHQHRDPLPQQRVRKRQK